MIRLSILLGLLASPVSAEIGTYDTTQICDSQNKIYNWIDSYGEELLFTGAGITMSTRTGDEYTSYTMFFVNQDTGTWSLLGVYPDGTACVVTTGTNFEPYAG